MRGGAGEGVFDGGLLRILKKLPSPLHATIFPPEQKKHRWTCSVFGSGDDICVCFKKNVSIAAFIVGGQAFFFNTRKSVCGLGKRT